MPTPVRTVRDFERDSMREQRWWRHDDLCEVAAVLLNPPELPALLAHVGAADRTAPAQ